MTQTKQAKHTGEWFTRGTAGHETHGQWAIYTDTGSTIAVVYDGKAHAERIVRAVNSHEELLGALQEVLSGTLVEKGQVMIRGCPSRDSILRAIKALAKAHATGE